MLSGIEKTRLTARVSASPLVQRYAQKQQSKRTTIETPADALGEREVWALIMQAHPEIFCGGGFDAPSLEERRLVDNALSQVGNLAMRAEVFLWANETFDVASAMTLPETRFGVDTVPYPLMWWTFRDSPNTSDDGALQSILIQRVSDGLMVYAIIDTTFGQGPPRPGQFRLVFDSAKDGELIRDSPSMIGTTLKMIAFLNSKYIDASPQRLLRAERRAMGRAKRCEDADATVRVVLLRQPAGAPSDSAEVKSGRNWKLRWWVRGHIRAQWCPSTKSHRLIWIAPHLKGPEDKPIAQRIYKVAR